MAIRSDENRLSTIHSHNLYALLGHIAYSSTHAQFVGYGHKRGDYRAAPKDGLSKMAKNFCKMVMLFPNIKPIIGWKLALNA